MTDLEKTAWDAMHDVFLRAESDRAFNDRYGTLVEAASRALERADAEDTELTAAMEARERAMLMEALERNITNFKGQRADLDFARDALAKAKGEQK